MSIQPTSNFFGFSWEILKCKKCKKKVTNSGAISFNFALVDKSGKYLKEKDFVDNLEQLVMCENCKNISKHKDVIYKLGFFEKLFHYFSTRKIIILPKHHH